MCANKDAVMTDKEHDILHAIADLDKAMKEAYRCMKTLDKMADEKYGRQRDQGR